MSELAKIQNHTVHHSGRVNLKRSDLFGRFKEGCQRFKSQISLQSMVLPGIIWLIIFCYIPMYGIIIAFKDYKVSMGFFNGPWVGFKHFEAFFADQFALKAIS